MFPGGIREIVREGARIGIDPLPQTEQCGRRVAGEDLGVERPERIVPLVEDRPGDRERRHLAEDVKQVLAVALGRVRAEIEVVLVERPAAPVAGAGEARRGRRGRCPRGTARRRIRESRRRPPASGALRARNRRCSRSVRAWTPAGAPSAGTFPGPDVPCTAPAGRLPRSARRRVRSARQSAASITRRPACRLPVGPGLTHGWSAYG